MKTPSLTALLLPGLLYPVQRAHLMAGVGPYRVVMDGRPLALSRNASAALVAHSDVCPHQGARLSSGRVDARGHLYCPYHGFAFHNGAFLEIPNGGPPRPCAPRPRSTAWQMDVWPCFEDATHVYVQAPGLQPENVRLGVHYPHEHVNPAFRSIHGVRRVAANQMALTENLLDCLHISYVHSFGSRVTPLPMHVQYHSLGRGSGRATFTYRPRPGSLSTWLAASPTKVVVENEFHLPSTTITRVSTGAAVKTVLTRALPLDDGSSLLFWSVYRNFWTAPLVDGLIGALMELTIDEDVRMLKNVYQDDARRQGPLQTKYDVTIQHYRAAVRDWIHDARDVP